MVIIGCDFHPGFQQIAMVDTEDGAVRELRLSHRQEAERFYASLQGQQVLVGVEACGYTQWFEQMLEEMGHGYRIGDAAAIRASYVRRQKTDRRDAGHILRLLVEGRFPALWVPSAAERDARQLIVHRHKRVETDAVLCLDNSQRRHTQDDRALVRIYLTATVSANRRGRWPDLHSSRRRSLCFS